MSGLILLVDDEVDYLETLAERLVVRNFQPILASTWESALESLRTNPFEAILLDLNLPGKSGLDLLTEIKEMRPLTEVIILTGESGVHTAIEGMKRGAFDFLIKPVDIDALVEVLTLALRKRSREMENLRMVETGKMAALGSLAEGIAHEIINPVNIMHSEAGWIEELLVDADFPSPAVLEDIKKALKRIQTHGLRCKQIIDQLFRLTGRADPRRQPVNLSDLLSEVIEVFRQNAASTGINIMTDFSPGIPLLRISRDEMKLVFDHLLQNAIDAMTGNGGTLTLAMIVTGTYLVTTVKDTGHGIDPKILPRIFEPFFSTREVGKGTGLGLAICYNLLTALGGDISVASILGEGSTFTVRLPIQPLMVANSAPLGT